MVLLENTNLALKAGAKVGVIGPNGAGKSTLLRIFAGHDTEFDGQAWRTSGLRIGMLEQEPHIDDERSVIDNVLDGVSEQRDALASFDRVSRALETISPTAEADELEELITEQAALTERIEKLDCWELTRKVLRSVNVRLQLL